MRSKNENYEKILIKVIKNNTFLFSLIQYCTLYLSLSKMDMKVIGLIVLIKAVSKFN